MLLPSRCANHPARSGAIALAYTRINSLTSFSHLRRQSILFSTKQHAVKPQHTQPPHVSHEESEIRTALQCVIPTVLQRKYGTSFETLAKLNDFKSIQVGEPRRVQLAEGIIAEANKKTHKAMKIFSRQTGSLPPKQHPPFLEEDFTLYRIMEKKVEERFDQQEDRIRQWYDENVGRAHDRAQNVYESVLTRFPVSKVMGRHNIKVASEVEDNREAPEMGALINQAGSEVNEDLLILSGGRVVLVEDVPPQYRLLALPQTLSLQPYKLRHGRSGTVIYTGLVLFGAVPVAYRSFKYALDYPGLAKAMVASVVGTIAYSLWASRQSARTRQSLVINSAVASRIVARDDAARLQLVDGATKALVEAVMFEYLSRLEAYKDRTYETKTPHTVLPENMDPVEIALELGLLTRGGSSSDLTANGMSAVLSGLTKSVFNHLK